VGSPVDGCFVPPPVPPRTRAAGDRQAEITGLVPGVSYNVYIRAANTYGPGAAAIKLAVKVPDTSYAHPGFVAATPGAASTEVCWSPPTAPAGTVTGYRVSAVPADPPRPGYPAPPAATATTDAATRRVTPTGLAPGNPYEVTVSAVYGAVQHPAPARAVTPTAEVTGPSWSGWDIARDVAAPADGSAGYVLDGYGGLHRRHGPGGDSPAPAGAPYWSGWDIARGLALTVDGTGGYVLDGYGGLHPFGLGGHPKPPKPTGAPYWRGWDIARGVAIGAYGATGEVLDGWGGAHRFTLP